MKTLLFALVLCASTAFALTDEEWAAQEAKHLKEVEQQYAEQLKDPKFVQELKDAQDLAEYRQDPIFESPDWPLKVAERAHNKVFGKPASSSAEVIWKSEESKWIEETKRRFARELSDQQFVEALYKAEESAKYYNDPIFNHPDWMIKLAERVAAQRNVVVSESPKLTWTQQELLYKQEAQRRFATAFADKDFSYKVTLASRAAHDRRDAILQNPDWPLIIAEGVYKQWVADAESLRVTIAESKQREHEMEIERVRRIQMRRLIGAIENLNTNSIK